MSDDLVAAVEVNFPQNHPGEISFDGPDSLASAKEFVDFFTAADYSTEIVTLQIFDRDGAVYETKHVPITEFREAWCSHSYPSGLTGYSMPNSF